VKYAGLDINNSTRDQITVGGTLTASGVTELKFTPPASGLISGTYTLITAANPVSAVAGNFSIAGLTSGPRPQTFSIAVNGNLVQLVVVGSPGILTWVGDGTANLWNIATTSNWWNTLNLVKDVFYAGDAVTFDGTGSNTPAINLVTSLSPSAVTVSGSANYTFSGVGEIAGATALTKSGSGTLTLNTLNTYSGATVVSDGTLTVNGEISGGGDFTLNGGALVLGSSGAIGGSGTISFGGGTLQFSAANTTDYSSRFGTTAGQAYKLDTAGQDLTLASSLTIASPGGTLTKIGSGNLTLSVANTNILVTVNGGSVVCGDGRATGAAGAGAAGTTIQEGSVDINGQGNYTAAGGLNAYLFTTTVTFGQKAGASTELKDTTGAVPPHGGFSSFVSSTPSIVYDGANNPGAAVISAPWYGSGTQNASTRQVQVGVSANAAIGLEITGVMGQTAATDGRSTTIEKTGAGVLKISNTNFFPGLKISAGKLIVGHVNALGAVRTLANTVTVTNGTLDLNGFSPTISDLEDGGQTAGLVLNSGGSTSTLTVNHDTIASTFGGTLANGSGTLALVKAGANTVTLPGVNTYTGGTTVSSGTLLVNGSIVGGVTVQSGATLGGFGTISGVVTADVGGTVAPGSSIGTLTLGSSPVLNGTVRMEVNRNGGTPLADQIVVTGNPIAYNGTLVIANTGLPLQAGDTFTLFNASGYSGGFTLVSQTPGQVVTWNTSNLTLNGSISVAAVDPPMDLPPFVPVFTSGVDGYSCYRIPAMVTTTNGTVIAMADGRISSCDDIPNPIDLVVKRSFDNGNTWGLMQVVTDYGSNTNDTDDYPYYGLTGISRVSSGDAALLVDRTNGRLWTLYDNSGVLIGERKIKLEMKYSDDDGATWSSRIDVEALNPGLRPAEAFFLTGPGNGIQLSTGPAAGRLIFGTYTPGYSTIIYSDDHGVTWSLGGNAGGGGGEIQVAETPDGGLIASMRDSGFPSSGVRTFSRSADGGITWSAPYNNTIDPPSIPDPAVQASIYRFTTTNDSNVSRLVHANPADASSRSNMTLRISYDEGVTWPVSNQVYAAGSAYSSVTKLPTGEIGLLFEKDPDSGLQYTRRSVSQITGGADSLPAYDVWKAGQFSPAQLMNPAISGPDADPDGDGYTNYQEFAAGTGPLNALSNLKLNITRTPTNALLNFDGISNKSYTVQYRAALNTGSWQPLTNVATLVTNSAVAIPVPATNAARFYRLTTPQLP
jgi:sialidase-1